MKEFQIFFRITEGKIDSISIYADCYEFDTDNKLIIFKCKNNNVGLFKFDEIIGIGVTLTKLS